MEGGIIFVVNTGAGVHAQVQALFQYLQIVLAGQIIFGKALEKPLLGSHAAESRDGAAERGRRCCIEPGRFFCKASPASLGWGIQQNDCVGNLSIQGCCPWLVESKHSPSAN